VITVELKQPTPVNANNVYDQLVLFTNPENVKYVFVNGECLKKDGKILTIDKEAARERLKQVTEQFWNVNERK
jgi:cytosine/adenosine deaminase-related metal-dependent hydrolase